MALNGDTMVRPTTVDVKDREGRVIGYRAAPVPAPTFVKAIQGATCLEDVAENVERLTNGIKMDLGTVKTKMDSLRKRGKVENVPYFANLPKLRSKHSVGAGGRKLDLSALAAIAESGDDESGDDDNS